MSSTASPSAKSPLPDTVDRRTLLWVLALSTAALVFDGYDLVVYGTVVPTLLAEPEHLGALSPEQAGTLGSYALVGVLVGALTAGAVGDLVGRRKVMLVNLAWFSIGMAATAMATSLATFGLFRFLTGIGVGALVATVGALVAELAPAERRNRYNAIVYSGIPAGGVMAAVLALVLDDVTGWRGLFWIGAAPLVVLLPLAYLKLPESPRWLAAREARAVAGPVLGTKPKVGFSALATRRLGPSTLVLGMMSFSGLLLTYGLNTWLPQIMGANGYGKDYALLFLLVLNLGAIVGGLQASYVADRIGAKKVITTTFLLASLMLLLLPLSLPLAVLLVAVALAGVGTIGTQVLIYGLVAHHYPTTARAAGVAWCAGFGRLGGILGPVIGGFIVGRGLDGQAAFLVFAGVSVAGALFTASVPAAPEDEVEALIEAEPAAV